MPEKAIFVAGTTRIFEESPEGLAGPGKTVPAGFHHRRGIFVVRQRSGHAAYEIVEVRAELVRRARTNRMATAASGKDSLAILG